MRYAARSCWPIITGRQRLAGMFPRRNRPTPSVGIIMPCWRLASCRRDGSNGCKGGAPAIYNRMTDAQPLVTVVIPTYNRLPLIGQAIDSVLAQTYDRWELILVDDESTDG